LYDLNISEKKISEIDEKFSGANPQTNSNLKTKKGRKDAIIPKQEIFDREKNLLKFD